MANKTKKNDAANTVIEVHDNGDGVKELPGELTTDLPAPGHPGFTDPDLAEDIEIDGDRELEGLARQAVTSIVDFIDVIHQIQSHNARHGQDETKVAGFVSRAMIAYRMRPVMSEGHEIRHALTLPANRNMFDMALAAASMLISSAKKGSTPAGDNHLPTLERFAAVLPKHKFWRDAQRELEYLSRQDHAEMQKVHAAEHEKRIAEAARKATQALRAPIVHKDPPPKDYDAGNGPALPAELGEDDSGVPDLTVG